MIILLFFKKFKLAGAFFLLSILFGDYSDYGQFEVAIEANDITTSNGLILEYSLFSPVGSENLSYVILAHGFSRNKSVMDGFAYHYASWGIKVITMDLLHSSIIDNDPFQDANDLNLISQEICDGRPVIYAGHSAGAMRGIVAAQQDTNAIAFLGLDLVDASNDSLGGEYLALTYVSNISIPVWGLVGEPGSCNANGNGLNVYSSAGSGNAIGVSEADHCDFELPTDILCTFFCQGSNDMFTNEDIKKVILNLSTGFLLYHSGESDNSIDLWYPGNDYYNAQISNGAIQQLITLKTDKNHINPPKVRLGDNFPNPFNPNTNIIYELEEESFVKITIYDMLGNVVNTLVDENQYCGYKTIEWDATNYHGQLVSAGVYFYRIDTEKFNRTKKMIFLK